eukprot:6805945-Heterocapsa_arctica.AAC.1
MDSGETRLAPALGHTARPLVQSQDNRQQRLGVGRARPHVCAPHHDHHARRKTCWRDAGEPENLRALGFPPRQGGGETSEARL